MSDASGPAGWHPDPTGRFEFRYFNGERWTSDVSTGGTRYVDNAGPPTNQSGWGPVVPADERPGRGMAITAFVAGLVAVLLSWVPFVFVLAGAAAIAGLVFGIVGLRSARRNDGLGRGFAGVGLALSAVAIPMCIIGFLFSQAVLRELNDFLEPGPYRVDAGRCDTSDGIVTFDGSITNLDDTRHGYTVVVRFRAQGAIVATDSTKVGAVAPGASVTFRATAAVDEEDVTCEIGDVRGPAPFAASGD